MNSRAPPAIKTSRDIAFSSGIVSANSPAKPPIVLPTFLTADVRSQPIAAARFVDALSATSILSVVTPMFSRNACAWTSSVSDATETRSKALAWSESCFVSSDVWTPALFIAPSRRRVAASSSPAFLTIDRKTFETVAIPAAAAANLRTLFVMPLNAFDIFAPAVFVLPSAARRSFSSREMSARSLTSSSPTGSAIALMSFFVLVRLRCEKTHHHRRVVFVLLKTPRSLVAGQRPSWLRRLHPSVKVWQTLRSMQCLGPVCCGLRQLDI